MTEDQLAQAFNLATQREANAARYAGARRVALLGCGAAKLEHAAPLRELYNGCLFRAARDDVERRGAPYFVVSALLGLRKPEHVATPYNLTIRAKTWRDEHRRAWGERCVRALRASFGDLRGVTVELHMGADYARWLRGPLAAHGATLEMPVKGAIGRRLRAYKMRRLGAETTGQMALFGGAR